MEVLKLGGTRVTFCAVGDENNNVVRKLISTTTPIETLDKCIEFFSRNLIIWFVLDFRGPIDIDKNSKTYGFITATPNTLGKWTPS